MLFNSLFFIFIFLPFVFSFYYLLLRFLPSFSIIFIIFASLFFYAWWNITFLFLLLFSIFINFIFAKIIYFKKKKLFLVLIIFFNILLLFYFKYYNFFISNINLVSNFNIVNNSIFLPLAISFYTFQQIAYQIDVYRRKTYEKNLINYILFVIFFPQLIAGPIVKHQVIKNQIDNLVNIKYNLEKILFGFIIFIIGLFKKIVIADNIAITSDSFFEAAKYEDAAFTFFESWGGVFSYSFQIYFDFSAYSDMAIGLAIILGIKIPINFNSPYKSCSIIDFWRTWHVTLSDFLREYVYFNLGGNRKGALLKYSNILITMLIGGFWHGASFMFILWGGLHGLLISLNHLWRFIFTKLNLMHVLQNNFIYLSCMRIFTFISVSLLWVFFRSENLLSIKNIFQGIIGMNGISLPYKMKQYVEFFLPSSLLNFFEFNNLGILGSNFIIFKLLALFFIVFLTPSVANIFFKNDLFIIDSKLPNLLKKRDIFVINYFWAIFIAVLFIISVTSINEIKEFVYFQF